jgi:hypothetical protein
MPAQKGRGLHNAQCFSPVEPAAEPDEGKTRGVGRTPRLDVSLLIQRRLFAQNEILSDQRGTKAQAESEEAHGINPKREQHGRELHAVAKSV